MEDLLEELVGEIRDEYDEAELNDLTMIVPGREYCVVGSYRIDDLNEHLALDLQSEDYDSIGGLLIEHLDSLPMTGQSVTLPDGIRLVAERVQKNRIELVHIYIPQPNTQA